jgi:hypothetical protein
MKAIAIPISSGLLAAFWFLTMGCDLVESPLALGGSSPRGQSLVRGEVVAGSAESPRVSLAAESRARAKPASATPPAPLPARPSLPAVAVDNRTSTVGMNLTGIRDFSPADTFVDIFKTSREWIPQRPEGGPWDTGESFAGFTPEGIPFLNPGQAAGNVYFADREIRPNGVYTLLYEGDGDFRFGQSARLVSGEPGALGVRLSGKGTAHLKIIRNNPDDPLRNIRFVMPGFEDNYEKQIFLPEYLDRWKSMKVLRFMDWNNTNGHPGVCEKDPERSCLLDVKDEWRGGCESVGGACVVRPQDRATPGYYSQATKGVAYEHMIDLSNRLEADPWVTIPHQATDAYVATVAQLFRDKLKPGLTLYVEYSNEVWNYVFAQNAFARQRGLALGLSEDQHVAMLLYYSQRSVDVFDIFEREFGGTQRLVRVMASQAANPWNARQILDWKDAYRKTDALAIAPYFGMGISPDSEHETTIAQMTIDDVLDACEQRGLPISFEFVANHRKLIKERKYGVKLVAYEGGQHLSAHGTAQNNKTVTDLLIAANRHPRMEDITKRYLDGWRRNGGEMFVYYNSMEKSTKYGSWGVLEHTGQVPSEVPKYRALIRYLSENLSSPPSSPSSMRWEPK